MAWYRRLLLGPLFLLLACTGSFPTPQWGTSARTGPASYQQCINPYGASNPACVAAGVSPGQAFAPAAVRGSQAVGTVVRAAEALQGFITVTRFLDAAQQSTVEAILKTCVEEANRSVDEKLFGKDRTLPDSE
ncbi:MAG TPA: hypothetical protein VLQ93_09710, partial [Myxococcaceae bacterium]|nr:hypothetical protein [Myxococcaceae bacterium]